MVQAQVTKPEKQKITAGNSGISFGTWFVMTSGPLFGTKASCVQNGKVVDITSQ